MKAFLADGEGPIPAELSEAAATERQRLVEAVAECDDALLEKYLGDGELTDEEILEALRKGVREHEILPVFCGSATSLVGVDLLLKSAVELLPSPADRGPWPAEDLADGASHPLRGRSQRSLRRRRPEDRDRPLRRAPSPCCASSRARRSPT